MNTRQAIIAGTGDTSLEPGQFAWLDNKEAVLQITQGAVDVYAVKNFDSWRRQKVFLFEASIGKPLFSLPPEEVPDLRFMIVAPKGATLRAMSQHSLLASAAAGGEHTLESLHFMLEDWLEMLLSALISEAVPLAFIPISSGETITVKESQIVRSHKHLTWVRLEEGSACYGPMPEYKAEAKTVLPLIGSNWLVAKQETVLTGLSSEQIFPASLTANPAVFWQPLSDCHKLAGMFINQYFALTAAKNKARLKEQLAQQDKLLKGSIAHLLKSQAAGLPPAIGADTASPMVAAVKIVADYLGIPEEEVRIPTGLDPKRQDIFMLKNITRLAGMQIREVKLEKSWYCRDIGPVLGVVGPEENLAVFIPASPQKYLMYTPDGLYLEVTADLASEISETAYVFYAPIRGTNISTFDCFKFMLQKCWKKDIWTLIITSFAAGLIAIITPLVTKTVFEDIIPMYDRQGHLMVVQVMVVSAFSAAGVGFARNIAIVRLRSRSLLAMEAAFWLRLLSLPVRFFRNYQTGDIVQRMQGITQISTLLSTSSIAAIFNLAFSFSSLLIMLYYSWKLSLAALLVWTVYLTLSSLLLWRLVYASRRTEEAAGRTAGKVLQLFNGLSKFRIKKAESQAFYLWAHKFGEQWRFNYSAQWKNSFLGLLNIIQPTLMSMLIFWLTIYFLQSDSNTVFITQPDFMGFHSALGGLNVTIVGLVNTFATLPNIIPLAQRIKPLLEAEPEITVNKADPGELSGQIEINNVSFRYSPERPMTLKEISMVAQPGQFLAVVGASGSGKSTLLRLLLGFEKPESGSIYYDGQDINELNLNSVRSQMGVVLQNGQIMSGDIFNNIVGALPLTVDDAWEAAEMVGIAEDIRRMPMGMHTVISEGASNISGGQRQRILIARAIVHRPRIILFDEATSALDNKTQAIVSESISGLNATRIVVAHRLSTIINADIIYVLEKGQIVEVGNYNELMNKNGYFATLARRQML